jgi:hypothetical protein
MTLGRMRWPLVVVLALALGGCSLFGNAGRGIKSAAPALKAGRGAAHFVPAGDDASRNARPLSEVARDLSAAPEPTPGRSVPEVRQGLAEIYAADKAVDSEYDRLLVDAFCLGMDQLAGMAEGTEIDEEQWKAYFLQYFDQFGDNTIAGYARDYAEGKIDDLLTAMNLSQVSPSTARAYVEHCLDASP